MFNPLILLGLIPGCIWSILIGWFFITIASVIYVYNDCIRGKKPAIFWTVITIVFSFIGMVAYVIWKSTQPSRGWRG